MTSRLRKAILHRLSHYRQADRGSVLIWFVITTPVIILLATLVIDGGAKLTAAEQASKDAAQAARAAAIAVGPLPANNSTETQVAVRAATSYLAGAGVHGTATVTGPATVTVTVTVHRTGPISGTTFSITRTATARLLVGIDTGQTP